MRSRQEIKQMAKYQMGQQRGTAILLGIVVSLISLVFVLLERVVAVTIPPLFWVVNIAGMAVITVAGVNMLGEYIKIYCGNRASAANVINNMQVNFLRKLGGSLWMSLLIFLWTLLFIIPGIVKGMSYYFTQNVLADCPNVKARDALKISMKITSGYKMDVFIFILSWIGWYLLSVLTFGILAIIFVTPYHMTSDAGFYLELREKALAEGVITEEELGWRSKDDFDGGSQAGFAGDL